MRTIKMLITPLLLFILISCNFPAILPASESQNTETDSEGSDITSAGNSGETYTLCVASSFGKFYEMWPTGFELQTTTPRLTWIYNFHDFNPGSVEAWEDLCVPKRFAIYLSTGPDFTDEIVYQVDNPNYGFDIAKLTLDWVVTPPLEPAKTYRWIAVGYFDDISIGTGRIAQLHDETKWVPLTTIFNQGVFRTGPECESGQVGIPTLTPFENGQTESLRPRFAWSETSCALRVFTIQISTRPDFVNIHTQQDFSWSDPGDFTLQVASQVPYFVPFTDLRDCTMYYWRVRGGIGDAGSREFSEWSDTGTVYISHSGCPPYSTPTATSMYQYVTPDTGTYDVTPNPPVVCSSYTTPDACNSHSATCYWAGKITNPNEGECKTK